VKGLHATREVLTLNHHIPRVGLRTIKTGFAVALALWFSSLRNSPAPIFAAIGAISAMSRTLGDAFKTCLTEFCGLILGAVFGTVFVNVFAGFQYIGIGLGLVALILLCVQLGLHFAVALACMVFVSICLSPPNEALMYSVNRLADTSIGLATALVVNVLIKPYNNRARIDSIISQFLESAPSFVEELVVKRRYPDIEPLKNQLHTLDWELGVFETQHVFREHDHDEQVAFLRGLEQLAESVVQELITLCGMDETGALSEANADYLSILGLSVPEGIAGPVRTQADIVSNYHLSSLIQAYQYLREFSSM